MYYTYIFGFAPRTWNVERQVENEMIWGYFGVCVRCTTHFLHCALRNAALELLALRSGQERLAAWWPHCSSVSWAALFLKFMACSWQFVFIQGVALERTWPLWTTSTLVPWPPWLLWSFHGFRSRIVTSRHRRQDLCAERGTSGATYGPECSRSGFNDGWLGWVLMGMDGWWSEEKVVFLIVICHPLSSPHLRSDA